MSASDLPVQQDLHALYSDHHGWLLGWLRRRLGNAADAADLAHDAFLRLIVRPAPDGFASAGAAFIIDAKSRNATWPSFS